MIFPDTPAEKWLDKYPALKEGFPLCTCAQPHLRPYRTRKSVGIECLDCKTAVWTRTKFEDNQYFLGLLTGLLK